MSLFYKNVEILFALTDKSSNQILEEIGLNPRSKYNWQHTEPHRATARRLADYFIHREGYPAHLFNGGQALFNSDFKEIIINNLINKPESSLMVKEPATHYGGITKAEARLIPCLRKVYGSVLPESVVDRICMLLEIMGIDSPLFTAMLDMIRKDK